MADQRPPLSRSMSAAEFRRWYWLKSELVDFARTLEVPTSGAKPRVADRIAPHLAGHAVPPATPTRARAEKIDGVIDRSTIIPPNQTASQQLRRFFEAEIGSTFRYDYFMRTFLADNPGKTLGDAVKHWHETRSAQTPETLQQLELIRFTKTWHLAHADGTAAQCRAAWKVHRSLPVDERPGPENMSPETL